MSLVTAISPRAAVDVIFVFVAIFWASFEQAGGLMNLYASEKTDRMVGAFEVPAGWRSDGQRVRPVRRVAQIHRKRLSVVAGV